MPSGLGFGQRPGHTDDSVAVGALTESPTPTEAVCHSVRGDMLLQLRPTASVVDFGCELLYQGVDLFVVAADSAFAEDTFDAFAKILPFSGAKRSAAPAPTMAPPRKALRIVRLFIIVVWIRVDYYFFSSSSAISSASSSILLRRSLMPFSSDTQR